MKYQINGKQLSIITVTISSLTDRVAQLAEHWTSIPKVAGSIPTVAKKTFQFARCGCTLRVTSQTFYVFANYSSKANCYQNKKNSLIFQSEFDQGRREISDRCNILFFVRPV